jgi:hypothetical protein
MKNILLTETELSVIGMIFQDYGKQIEQDYCWGDEDWAAYLSILKYLKEKQYICEE